MLNLFIKNTCTPNLWNAWFPLKWQLWSTSELKYIIILLTVEPKKQSLHLFVPQLPFSQPGCPVIFPFSDLFLLNGCSFWQQTLWLVFPGYKWCLVCLAGYRKRRLLITEEKHSDTVEKSDTKKWLCLKNGFAWERRKFLFFWNKRQYSK